MLFYQKEFRFLSYIVSSQQICIKEKRIDTVKILLKKKSV